MDNIIGIVTDFLVYRASSFARPKFGTQEEVWFQFQFPEFKISNWQCFTSFLATVLGATNS